MKYVALLKPDNDLILKGIICITTLQELYSSIWLDECTELEIRKEFSDQYFTYQGIVDFTSSCALMFPNINVVVEDTMFKNMEEAAHTLQHYREPQEFEFALTKDPTKVMSTIHELCKYYFETQEDSSIASNKLATLLMQVSNLQKDNEAKDNRMKQLENQLNETEAKLHSLVQRVNYHYDKTVDEKTLFELKENQFVHILYVKEISRVHYTDTLLYYLREIVKTLYGEPIRTVVIEPFYAYQRASLYPGYIPHWKTTYRDIYQENIYMAGLQPNMMQDILQNSNHIHFLIILDRSGCNAPFVSGSNVTTIYTVSDLTDAEHVNSPYIISYDANTLNIPYIDNFNSLSIEEKIQKYSTMPIMKTLLDLLENRV